MRAPPHPDLPDRQGRRWQAWDYSLAARYFVTISVQNQRCVFGWARADGVVLSPAGKAVLRIWREVARGWPHVHVEQHVLMPNHLHGIVYLEPCREPGRPQPRAGLSRVIQAFKSLTTRVYGKGVREHGWTDLDGPLWQRGFYDRVLRGDEEVAHARDYIRRNPETWWRDHQHPDRRA